MNDARHRFGGVRFRMLGWLGMVAAVGSGCVPRASSLTVPLELRPTQVANAATTAMQGRGRVYVPAVQDARPQQDRIGENRESSPAIPIYAGSSPTLFVREALIEQLKANGVAVADSANAADAIVVVTLNRFWAEESPNYDAQIVLAVEVRGRDGAVRWSGTTSGNDGTFGRSLSAENYQQVLSNALVNAVAVLVAKPQFQQALVARPRAQPAQAPRRKH